MKKQLLILIFMLSAFGIQRADAQSYTFSHTTSTYAALTNSTVVSTPYWDDYSVFGIQLPFAITYFGASFDSIFVMGGFEGFIYDGQGSFGDYEIGSYEYSALIDPSGTATISHEVSGSAPNRIFKVETGNAGFYGNSAGTDYTNFQVWFFESTNVIEIHFGPNSIVDPLSWMIPGSTGPGIILAQTASNFVALSGPASNPNATTTFVNFTVGGAPANGMVYRFTPLAAGIHDVNNNNLVSLFPNPNNGSFTINIPNLNSTVDLSIYNNLGQEIHSEEINISNGETNLNLQLPSGIYTTVINNGNEKWTKKLVVY